MVEELLKEDVKEIIVYDNFTRGKRENLMTAMQDERVKIIEGDITYVDVLNDALKGADFVFHLAALWLLHCYEYPRAAFQVNIEGTFNVLPPARKSHHQTNKSNYARSPFWALRQHGTSPCPGKGVQPESH